jgi:hypothetical protein
MYVLVKDLPARIQRAIASIPYHQKEIDCEVRDSVSLQVSGSQGQRGFAITIDLATGSTERFDGSWGGSNMFSPTNRVDNDDRSRVLGDNVVVLKGSTGNRTYVTLYLGSDKLIPKTEVVQLPVKSRQILYCFRALKSGVYRNEALAKIKATEEEINNLIASKHLKRDGRGTMITMEGKNAIDGVHSMPSEEKSS